MKSSHPDYSAVNSLADSIARLVNWGAVGFTYRNEDQSPRLSIESPEDKVRQAVAVAEMKEALGNLIGCSAVWYSYIYAGDIQDSMRELIIGTLGKDDGEFLFNFLNTGDTASGIQ